MSGENSNDQIGFIGIGNKGFPMAQNILEGGHPVLVYDIRQSSLEDFREIGGRSAESSRKVAKECQKVHLMVQDDQQVNQVSHGPNGVLAGFSKKNENCQLIIHSTVHPETCISIAEDAPENVDVIGAPISGAYPRAEHGDLTLMIGGEEAAIEESMPVFDLMARKVFHLGSLGSGQVAKIAHNLTCLSNMMATAEGLELGMEYGINRETLLEMFKESAADSAIVQKWEYFVDEWDDFHPGGLEALAYLSEKDLLLALDLANDTQVQLFGGAVASQKVPAYWREVAEN